MMTARERTLAVLGAGLILAAMILSLGCPIPGPHPPAPPTPPTPPVPPIVTPAFDVCVEILDLPVAEGDWRAAIKAIYDAGGRRIRFIADCQWNWQGTQPYEYAAYDEATAEKIRHKDPSDEKTIVNRNGIMTLVRESGAEFPLYDYTRPRAAYWAHLREILDYCREIGMAVYIDLLDYCTLKTPGDAKYYSPWMCAVQRMLPGIQNGTWGEQMKPWIAAFYGSVFEQVTASGVDYILEDMNEGDALGWDDAFMLAWFTWSNQMLRDLGVPVDRIATSASRNVPAIAALCGWYSAHGVGTADKIKSYNGVSINKMIWSSDGFWGGSGGCDAKGRCGVGVQAAGEIGAAVRAAGGKKYSILLREIYAKNNDRADLSLINTAPIVALHNSAIQ
jgi:hypothetical protein